MLTMVVLWMHCLAEASLMPWKTRALNYVDMVVSFGASGLLFTNVCGMPVTEGDAKPWYTGFTTLAWLISIVVGFLYAPQS